MRRTSPGLRPTSPLLFRLMPICRVVSLIVPGPARSADPEVTDPVMRARAARAAITRVAFFIRSPLRLSWAFSLSHRTPVCSWELHEKGRSFALCARKVDAPAVRFHDVARDGQSETCARYTASCSIAAEEFRKDLLLLTERDAHPLVANLDTDRAVLGFR